MKITTFEFKQLVGRHQLTGVDLTTANLWDDTISDVVMFKLDGAVYYVEEGHRIGGEYKEGERHRYLDSLANEFRALVVDCEYTDDDSFRGIVLRCPMSGNIVLEVGTNWDDADEIDDPTFVCIYSPECVTDEDRDCRMSDLESDAHECSCETTCSGIAVTEKLDDGKTKLRDMVPGDLVTMDDDGNLVIVDTVHVAVVSHRHGDNVYAGLSIDSVLAGVNCYVEEWWKEWGDDPMPEDLDERRAAYFERTNYTESHEDYVCELYEQGDDE